jgi:hypothetical protein
VIDHKGMGIIILMVAFVVMASGCASNYQTFDREGLSLQYPGNWSEISIPATDQNMANQSGFNITGVFIEGKSIENYTFIMEIAVTNITSSNLTAAADNLNNNYITKEANQAPLVNRTTLKNGYETVIYSYNGTGAASHLTVYVNTYIFTKDNKTAYYIIFGTPNNNITENQNTIQKIVNTITIK